MFPSQKAAVAVALVAHIFFGVLVSKRQVAALSSRQIMGKRVCGEILHGKFIGQPG